MQLQEVRGYGPQDYQSFPRFYVEGVESGEYMIVDLETLTYKLSPNPTGPLALGKAIYEDAWDLVLEPLEGKAKRGYALILPWRGFEAIYIPRGTRLSLVEAGGVRVDFTVREGDKVEERDVVAYVVTGKGEVRTVRAGARGVVVLIAWQKSRDPLRYTIAVADNADVYTLRRSL
ncbi:DUF2118 domain-containing protein [Stetteria hydrogenophila]